MAGEIDTGMNNQADNMNLKFAASETGSKSASEILLGDSGIRDVQTTVDKSAIGDGNVRGFTPTVAGQACSTLENTQFLAGCIEHVQNKAAERMSSIPAIAA